MTSQTSYHLHPGLRASSANSPKHIAIIMDGNGRWAKAQQFSRTKGHRKGVEAAREVIFACCDRHIQVLTLFAFGLENWKRPSKEVRNIFRIFFLVLHREVDRLFQRNIRLRIIGDRSYFNASMLKAIENAEQRTQHNTGLTLNIAINYSGRWDLLQAINQRLKQSPSTTEMTEADLNQGLALQGQPEPDLFIRTGGVLRISNFMLWELAYTELYFTPILWPDFSVQELDKALQEYAQRERRFGLTGDQL